MNSDEVINFFSNLKYQIPNNPEIMAMLPLLPVADHRSSESMEDKALFNLDGFINEAINTIHLITEYINNEQRILEIGGGIGLVYAYLKFKKLDITSLEPSGAGHDSYYEIGKKILQILNISDETYLNLAIENSDKSMGKYDLIFSNNVMEHIKNIDLAVEKMGGLLSSEGTMFHNMPNYCIPYEPHYNIPLLPFFPEYTSRIISSLQKESLWNSLNFITFRKFKLICEKKNLSCTTTPDVFYNTLLRFDSDESFSRRHPLLKKIFRVLFKMKIVSLFRLLPASIATPMQVKVRHY